MTGGRGPRADYVIVDEVHLVPIVTVDIDDDGSAHVVRQWPAIEWPRRYGKRLIQRHLAGEVTIEAPLTEALLTALQPQFAAAQACIDRALTRLADDLRTPLPLARQHYAAVVQTLEAAGIADGYGRLTIPQPVRPPVPMPTGWRRQP